MNKPKFLQLINTSIREHNVSAACEDLQWDIVDFGPWGAFLSVRLKCTSCNYKSDSTKLYDEVQSNNSSCCANEGGSR